METYLESPKGRCRLLVKILILVFFVGWNLHKLFSTIGPECLNKINAYQYEIGATFSDLVAKLLFCLLVNYYRVQVRCTADAACRIYSNCAPFSYHHFFLQTGCRLICVTPRCVQ